MFSHGWRHGPKYAGPPGLGWLRSFWEFARAGAGDQASSACRRSPLQGEGFDAQCWPSGAEGSLLGLAQTLVWGVCDFPQGRISCAQRQANAVRPYMPCVRDEP